MLHRTLALAGVVIGLGLSNWLVAATPSSLPSGPHDPIATAKAVDQSLAEELFADNDITLAPLTGDIAFLRRVTLDLLGRLPTPSEITTFALDPTPNKRQQVVERLLADPEYGANWGRYWRDVIFYRRAEDRALITARACEQFLTDALNANTPWNEIARAFVTATGDVTEEGTTAIIMAQSAETADVAAEISRIFLGVQIQCAQCHDHPTDRWTRDQFHEFAAFFPRIAMRPVFDPERRRIRSYEIVSRDEGPRTRVPTPLRGGTLEHYMPDLEDPSKQGTLMQPVFFATGAEFANNTYDLERREAIAAWMTSPENPWFARAIVNRMWAELVGEGFHEPVDDLGPDREPTAPATIARLSEGFAASGYDVKWLLQTILATEAYQRESRPRRLPDATPFTANCPQPLRGDQIYTILAALTGGEQSATFNRAMYSGFRGQPAGLRAQFNQIFGYDPSMPRTEVTGSIPQSLVLMNSNGFAQGISASNPNGRLYAILQANADNEDALVELYLTALAREPNDAELRVALAHLEQSKSRSEAFEDLLWALVNSTEFVYRN